MTELKTLSDKMNWLLEALIEEDEERVISIEYILMRAEVEFKEFIKKLKEEMGTGNFNLLECLRLIDKLSGDLK